jgi:hypothetical protein
VGHETEVTYQDAVTWFEHAIPDPADRDQIGRTALGLYGFV